MPAKKYEGTPEERRRKAVAVWKERHPESAKELSRKHARTPSGIEKRRIRQKATNLKNRLRAITHSGGLCAHCGEAFHHSAMDFHHVNPATKETKGKGITAGSSWTKVLKQLANVILLCANCHRIHHYRERNPECKTLLPRDPLLSELK